MMQDWNVIVTVFQGGFTRAIRTLRELGPVERSPYHNVLVMAVADPLELLHALERKTANDPALYDAISRVAPAINAIPAGCVEAPGDPGPLLLSSADAHEESVIRADIPVTSIQRYKRTYAPRAPSNLQTRGIKNEM